MFVFVVSAEIDFSHKAPPFLYLYLYLESRFARKMKGKVIFAFVSGILFAPKAGKMKSVEKLS